MINWSTDWEAAAAYASPETPILVGRVGHPQYTTAVIRVCTHWEWDGNEHQSYWLFDTVDGGFPIFGDKSPTHWTPCPLIEEVEG